MKILIAPDSFKGTLSAKQVCECIKKSLLEKNENLIIEALPMSDGGEGFAECLADICKGEKLNIPCSDIYGRRIKADIYTYGNTAVIESAKASGLQKKKDVMNATSYGTGELIKAAAERGFNNIILGLGGSGCCDGGAGALAALGVVFKDENCEEIPYPKGVDLEHIYGISFKNRVKGLNFTFACDVTNPMFGKNGAAYVFAPQKGANKEQVKALDNGLQLLGAFLPEKACKAEGAGAAGGLCGGLYAVYGGETKSGFDVIAEACSLEEKISESDLIITGEGKTDKQTLMGKLPYKVAELCKKHNKKCVIISGKIENVKLGDKMISLASNGITEDEAISNAEKILFDKAKYILN